MKIRWFKFQQNCAWIDHYRIMAICNVQFSNMKDCPKKVGLITKVLEKKKTIATSANLKFFDMPNQLLPEK